MGTIAPLLMPPAHIETLASIFFCIVSLISTQLHTPQYNSTHNQDLVLLYLHICLIISLT